VFRGSGGIEVTSTVLASRIINTTTTISVVDDDRLSKGDACGGRVWNEARACGRLYHD
jgi:hypothetical protein